MSHHEPPAQALPAVEAMYPVRIVAGLFFRGENWVIERCKAGDFGQVYRDGGGWMIPASGLNAYLRRHAVQVPGLERS